MASTSPLRFAVAPRCGFDKRLSRCYVEPMIYEMRQFKVQCDACSHSVVLTVERAVNTPNTRAGVDPPTQWARVTYRLPSDLTGVYTQESILLCPQCVVCDMADQIRARADLKHATHFQVRRFQ